MRLPLAVLLVSKRLQNEDRVRSVDYVEKTNCSSHVPSSPRAQTRRFQMGWPTAIPLPQRVVITYKKARRAAVPGAIFDWNLAPTIEDQRLWRAADGREGAFAAQLPRVSPATNKASKDKGAKR